MNKVIYILFLFFFLAPSVSAMTTLELLPYDVDVDQEQTFEIELYITPGEEIDTVAVDLITWDKEILDCISVTRGTLFNDSLIWIGGIINNSGGMLEGIVWGSQYPTSRPGSYATIAFKVKKDGYTSIVASKVGVARAGNDLEKKIINDCSVNSENLPVTTPKIKSDLNLIFIPIFIILFVVVCIAIAYFRSKSGKKVEKDEKGDIFN
jgi:hypothetical protein